MIDVLVNMEQAQNGSAPETDENGLPIYLLIVLGQTFSKEEKCTVLNRLNSSLLSIGDSLSAVKEDLCAAVHSELFESVKFDQENRIFYNNELNLVLEIVINSTGKTLRQSFRDFIFSPSKNKHFISATLDLNSNGDFNLQDSLFGFDNLNALLNEKEIKKLLLNTENSIKFHLNSKLLELNKNWKSLEKQHKNIHIINSQKSMIENQSSEYSEFLKGLDKYLNETPIDSLMETGKLTGTLRINKPLLYIFPSREGDSAYFTLNGYSILINGGYDRVKPCFWSFVNMLAQIDSILITHTDSDALGGLGSFFAKKLVDPEIKPNVLTVLGNLIASSDYKSPSDTNVEHAKLAADLIANESSANIDAKTTPYVDLIIESIERLKIQLMPLTKSNDQPIAKHNATLNNFSKYEHINLYYKLGQGSLDLYVLSPFANSADYKEFVQQQHNYLAKHQTHQKSQLNPSQIFKNIPMSHINSAVVLLVWLPHVTKQAVLAGENNALRLLFTGNAPQHVVINALDKVKDFEILTSPVYKIKPAPEPVHTIKKTSAGSENGARSAMNGANKSFTSTATTKSNTSTSAAPKPASSSTSSTSAKSSIASKPPAATAMKPKPKPVPVTKAASKIEKKPVTTDKTDKKPLITEKTIKKAIPTEKADKKPLALEKVDKKPISSVSKKTETSSTTRQSLSKTSTASTSSVKSTTGRLSTQGTKAPLPAKKSVSTKTASKPAPEVNMTEEEKKKSRIITKRDPKPSTTKPAISKTTETTKPKEAAKSDTPVASADSALVDEIVGSSTEATNTLVDAPAQEVDGMVKAPENDIAQASKQSESEWPNLSPVKHDQADQNCNNMDVHYMEDRNNSIDTNNESGIDADTEGKERKEMNFLISDAKDLIQTPDDDKNPLLDAMNNDDVMTRSFIDDGGVNSNPFAASTFAEDIKQKQTDDSINDLNKTHELSDYEVDKTEDNQELDTLNKDSENTEKEIQNEEKEEHALNPVMKIEELTTQMEDQVEKVIEQLAPSKQLIEESTEKSVYLVQDVEKTVQNVKEIVENNNEPVLDVDEPVLKVEKLVQNLEEPVQNIHTVEESVQKEEELVQNLEEPEQTNEQQVLNVDEPIQKVEEPFQKVEELVQNLKEPVESVDEPVQNVDEPVQNLEEQEQTNEQPVETVDEPVQKEEELIQNLEEPEQTDQEPIQKVEESFQNLKEPVETVDEPVLKVEKLVQNLEEPVQNIHTVEEPVQKEEELVQNLEEPVQKEEELVQNLEEPVQKEEELVQNLEEPVQNVDEPVLNLDEPVQKVEEPFQNLKEPVQTVDEPVQNLAEPVQKVEKLVQNLEEPVQTVEEALQNVDVEKNQNFTYKNADSMIVVMGENKSVPDESDIFDKLSVEHIKPDESHHEVLNGLNGHQNGHYEIEDGEIIESDQETSKVILKSETESLSSTVANEDPLKWNLLQLPKPVNPDNLPSPSDQKEEDKKPDTQIEQKSDQTNAKDKKIVSLNGKKTALNAQSKTAPKSISKSHSNINPVYVEVSYIPAHGDSAYVDTDFFRKVRARHYILSTEEPSEKLLDSIIEAKETWEEKSLQITIIPTYESEVLRKWYTLNEDTLARLKIDITPAASMSTLTMDDNPDLTCQLYKLEF